MPSLGKQENGVRGQCDYKKKNKQKTFLSKQKKNNLFVPIYYHLLSAWDIVIISTYICVNKEAGIYS